MAKLHRMADGMYAFHCPGCECGHAVTVVGTQNGSLRKWVWNGSMDVPTFTPSINCFADQPEIRCHSFVENGKIRFLDDSYHTLKGTMVEIPEWEE